MKPPPDSASTWLGTACLGLLLGACGVGDSSSPGQAPGPGTVTITDSSGAATTRTTTAQADGTFTLDVAASVRMDISRLVGGRTVKGKCVAETRKNRTRRSCTRRLSAGRLTIPGRAGADTVFFGGRTDGGSTLKPGHYRATVTALVAGGPASASRTVKFTVATP